MRTWEETKLEGSVTDREVFWRNLKKRKEENVAFDTGVLRGNFCVGVFWGE